jgi:hypothetical protein
MAQPPFPSPRRTDGLPLLPWGSHANPESPGPLPQQFSSFHPPPSSLSITTITGPENDLDHSPAESFTTTPQEIPSLHFIIMNAGSHLLDALDPSTVDHTTLEPLVPSKILAEEKSV